MYPTDYDGTRLMHPAALVEPSDSSDLAPLSGCSTSAAPLKYLEYVHITSFLLT